MFNKAGKWDRAFKVIKIVKSNKYQQFYIIKLFLRSQQTIWPNKKSLNSIQIKRVSSNNKADTKKLRNST